MWKLCPKSKWNVKWKAKEFTLNAGILLILIQEITVINASAAVTLLEQRPEKNSGSERDSNSRPLRCQCSALPTELSKPHESGRLRVSPLYGDVLTWPKYSKMKVICPIVAIE